MAMPRLATGVPSRIMPHPSTGSAAGKRGNTEMVETS